MTITIDKFINMLMSNNYKQLESENVKKIYNKDFDVLVYNLHKKPNAIVIDKRDAAETIIYNNLTIALHQLRNQVQTL